ncbi:MAG: pyrroline-5-carboxylate reductase [Bacillota bacterium]|nr:pyrroline-5-carboxylate reductase [Bacillota bacterium]
MKKTIGFIGCGNMASAMIGGIINAGLISSDNIYGSDTSNQRLDFVKEKFNIITNIDNKETVSFSDILVLSVKPNMYPKVIEEIKNYVKDDVIIVTIAAGVDLAFTEKCFGKEIKIVRVMPNTPALVGEGMSAVCSNNKVQKDELDSILKIFNSFGKAEIIDEKLMPAVTAISGSSPAYVYMFIEALADGGVLEGLPRDKAYKMAAQAVLGSAKMVLESGKNPAALKDEVCSPAGTTIEAVYTLEKNNFRGAVISAVESCTEKTIKMGKKN